MTTVVRGISCSIYSTLETAKKTLPTLKTAICEILTDWLEGTQPHHTTATTLHQHAVGFNLLHWGYLCTDWTHRQDTRETKTGHVWTHNLIIFL
jgi:hypothetical protein